jgi:hypothetical protein
MIVHPELEGSVEELREKTAPRARKEGLLVQELSDEVLVYDLERHKAHCLNPTAALVWKNCDGRTSIREMARLLEKSTGTSADEEIVWCALNQLKKFRLLTEANDFPVGVERISRRALIRRVGTAAVLLPLITTIAAPTAEAAASCGMACGVGDTCPSGCVCCADDVCRAVC